MGWPSFQEDNQDTAGEPVKAGKQKVPVIAIEEIEEFIEPHPRTEILKVKNTVIIKSDGLAINSIEIESYAFDITFMDGDEQLEPQIELTATADSGKVFQISTFYDIKQACALLTDLMSAIENQEVVFNVPEYIQNG